MTHEQWWKWQQYYPQYDLTAFNATLNAWKIGAQQAIINAAAPRFSPSKAKQCTCGNVYTPGIVHRLDGPCYVYEDNRAVNNSSLIEPSTQEQNRSQVRNGTPAVLSETTSKSFGVDGPIAKEKL